MLGPFKPTAFLSGGLLWKVPPRLSSLQKIRQRRRLRRVDNVVAVLDSALQRQARLSTSTQPQSQTDSSTITPDSETSDLSVTAEGRRLLHSQQNQALEARRRGRGPKLGDYISHNPTGTGPMMLSDSAREAGTTKSIERWKDIMPTEGEMLPKDKYTMFDRKAKGYRKGIHRLPKWTRCSQRLNPAGF